MQPLWLRSPQRKGSMDPPPPNPTETDPGPPYRKVPICEFWRDKTRAIS